MNSLNCGGGIVKSARLSCQNRTFLERISVIHTREAVRVDGSQKLEESRTVFWVLSEVLVDHAQRRFKDRVKNSRDLRREDGLILLISEQFQARGYNNTHLEFSNDSCHHVKDLCIPCGGDIAAVVAKDGVQQRRHETVVDSLEILRFADESLHQLQDLLLDST